MERFTMRKPGGVGFDADRLSLMIHRLAAYEDIGMTPDEIVDMQWDNEWHDARECTPIERGEYWVTINNDGIRAVKTRAYRVDWIVRDDEVVEAWMKIQKQPDLYERRE